VLVITGDGEMLMGIGSLATIGVQQPANLTVVVIDNERYGETGMQRTHTAEGVDLSAVAAACRFKHAVTVTAELAPLRELVYRTQGPNFAAVKVMDEKLPLVLPPHDGVLLKARFRRAVLGPKPQPTCCRKNASVRSRACFAAGALYEPRWSQLKP